MTEKIIQKALLYAFSSHVYKFINVYLFKNESDWLSFLQSGFCYEVEIKISRSDFKADFKKEKHLVHNSNDCKSKTFLRKVRENKAYNPSWELCKYYPELIESKEVVGRSYRTIENVSIEIWATTSTEIEFVKTEPKMIPNKFFYAVPSGLVSKEEVPEYAGLLYIDENMKVTKVKDGKFLHKEKIKPETLFNKMYYAYEAQLYNRLKQIP
jgi:hypothetical protein